MRKLFRVINDFLVDYSYHRGKVILKNFPTQIFIETTNHCNLKCIMCPRGAPDLMDRPLGHMDSALLEKIIRQTNIYVDFCWMHFYGEPLLNPDIFEQIRIAKTKINYVAITTNATLLNSENATRFIDSDIDEVRFSVDGISKEVYEHVRQSSKYTFESVMDNVKNFIELKRKRGLSKPKISINFVIMEETGDQIETARQYWINLGVDDVLFTPVLYWWESQDSEFNTLERSVDKQGSLSRREFPCKWLWHRLAITWDGLVVPCCYDYNNKMVLGDLKKQSFKEIWNGKAYQDLRKAELAGRNNSDLCKDCNTTTGEKRNSRWWYDFILNRLSKSDSWKRKP